MIQSISYKENTALLFEKFAHEPWAMFLDSCSHGTKGSYDIIAIRPHTTIESFANYSLVTTTNGTKTVFDIPPLDLIKKYLKLPPCPANHLPFTGGALGYFSYDLGRNLESIPTIAKDDFPVPLMQIGIYSTVILFDHTQKKGWLISDKANSLDHLLQSTSSYAHLPFRLKHAFQTNLPKDKYTQAFNTIMWHIKEGNCYQANLAQRFHAKFVGSTWMAYKRLRAINPVPYAAYLNTPTTTVLSFSPEQFIACKNKAVITKPIKGTTRRYRDPKKDQLSKLALIKSEKDKAENLMIVDLLRNDLGKVCQYGSIKVPELFSLESYPTVHHLVSTITGRLYDKYSSIDLLKACLPGGSITGTPKIRAMEIIEALEPHRRGIYCGSIGYINHDGNMDTNIAIRTLFTKNDTIFCSAGGAVVADSNLDAEYQECLDKVGNLINNLPLQ